ncbi:MAG: copper resistance protein CopC [Candidatus Limnocylindria bacterium]
MAKTDRSRRRQLLRWALALGLLAVAGSGVVPNPIVAHAMLVDADPAPSSVVPASPPNLVLFFSEAVDPAALRLRVLDSGQQPIVGLGTPRLDSTRQVVTASLPPLDPDTYTVDFAVVSAVDGHPTASLFAFLVDPTGTRPPPGSLPTETITPPDPYAIAARWVATVVALLLLGTILVWLLHRRWIGATAAQVPWGILAALAAIGLVAFAVHLTFAASAAFGPPGQPGGHPAVHLDFAEPFGWTPFAIAMRVAMIGLLSVFLVAGARAFRTTPAGSDPPPTGGGTAALALCGAGATATILGLSLTGHAASLGGPLFGLVDAIHLLAIAAWLGALPALGLLAWRARGPTGDGGEVGRRALRAHARVALVAAPVVVLTGLTNSPLVVGDSRELAAAGYGNLLLAKAALVSAALGLGAANFFLARNRGGRSMAAIVGMELAVATIAVAVGTTMVSLPPATDRPPSTVDPRLGVAHLYGESGESTVHGVVDLPEPGVQFYSFAVSDPVTGVGREDVAQVAISFIPPAGTDLPTDVALAQRGSQPWLWELQGAYTPVVGTWELEVLVRRGRLEEDRVRFPLAVRQVLRPAALPPSTTGSLILGAIAAPTSGLPSGPGGWGLPIGMLVGVAALMAVEWSRTRRGRPRWGPGRRLRLVILLAAVGIGTSLVARDAVAFANRPPDVWRAADNPLAGDSDAVAAGESLYRANCASCHGTDGAGDGPAVGDLVRRPEDLAGVVPHRLDGELAWTLAAGVAGTQMPAFGTTLLEGERWELVSFLRSHWPPPAE